jgi:hypothetical protein
MINLIGNVIGYYGSGSSEQVSYYDTTTGLRTTAVQYYDTSDDSIIGTVQYATI